MGTRRVQADALRTPVTAVGPPVGVTAAGRYGLLTDLSGATRGLQRNTQC